MLEAKVKDQEHKRKCSPKKKGLHKNFSGDLKKKKIKKKVFQKFFQMLHKILTIQKIVLPSSRRPPKFVDLRLRGQGQGLQNVSSRTPPLLIIALG